MTTHRAAPVRLDNITVGDLVILVERWRVEEKYVRRVTTNLLWVYGLKNAFGRKSGKLDMNTWVEPPRYPFIATNSDMETETAACDKRLAVRRISKKYWDGDTNHDVSIERIRKDCEHIDARIYNREKHIAEISAELDRWKADRPAHFERAAIAEAALRELGFTDEDV